MCPHLTQGSQDLINAAKIDGNDWANYGVWRRISMIRVDVVLLSNFIFALLW
jgi:hypothetical protein